MPTRDTPPPAPLTLWATTELLEELGLALRDVANFEMDLPEGERATAHVRRVQSAHTELIRREVDLAPFLTELSAQTQWRMAPLLDECLAFPDVVPAVRDEDGVRRYYRCPLCRQREFPNREGIWLCDPCVANATVAVRSRTPLAGMVVFRSYTSEKWCAHADAETVLIAMDDYDAFGPGYCSECLVAEVRRRADALHDAAT